jgi:hypothetical protein
MEPVAYFWFRSSKRRPNRGSAIFAEHSASTALESNWRTSLENIHENTIDLMKIPVGPSMTTKSDCTDSEALPPAYIIGPGVRVPTTSIPVTTTTRHAPAVGGKAGGLRMGGRREQLLDVRASPMYRLRRRSTHAVLCERLLSTPARSAYCIVDSVVSCRCCAAEWPYSDVKRSNRRPYVQA